MTRDAEHMTYANNPRSAVCPMAWMSWGTTKARIPAPKKVTADPHAMPTSTKFVSIVTPRERVTSIET